MKQLSRARYASFKREFNNLRTGLTRLPFTCLKPLCRFACVTS
jgi:hypothetical protein